MTSKKQTTQASSFLILLLGTVFILALSIIMTGKGNFSLGKKAANPSGPVTFANPTPTGALKPLAIENLSVTVDGNNPTVAYVKWATSSQATTSYVAYDTDFAYLFGPSTSWSRYGWRVNDNNFVIYHSVRIGGLDRYKNYYFRVAGKTGTGKQVEAPSYVSVIRPNCCGYNTAQKQWYCYTSCNGASSVTTLYPKNTCTTAAQCVNIVR